MNSTNHFLNCNTEDSISVRYKLLAKQLHPDKNGSTPEAEENFKQLLNQKDEALKAVWRRSNIAEIEYTSLTAAFNERNKIHFDKTMETMIEDYAQKNPGKNPSLWESILFAYRAVKKASEEKKAAARNNISPPQKQIE